ncbi:hypothetical protein GpartN1_g4528.t1 [Galdieria partita]|uniref:Queuine tRNA-ribosyltransferase catalytic subunit 1 n=1 Tax=Galdieria partita TaxID=83374 RepID=A0A9C7PZH9_9RHOD|nr:hypothetical protein GpartN1_g4528.t1 [Galdieria partita]
MLSSQPNGNIDLLLNVDASWNKARATTFRLPHCTVETPVFMPVGTQASVKGLTSEQLVEINCPIVLGNTFHLALRPGEDTLDQLGGIQKFMSWPKAVLTDSGGFQMVSLLELSKLTEEGVWFQSPMDGKDMLLSPERSVAVQNKIGADIIMALDDVVSSTTTGPRVEEAMYRTIRWLDRCWNAHGRKHDQALFGIVQGGLDSTLRNVCLDELVKRDLPGYAIGGLAGGEDKKLFWRIVSQCTDKLPQNKPRYCMGVGYPVDLIVCVALGVDMFDCVYPARTARFGTALTSDGTIKIKSSSMIRDYGPLDRLCSCTVCRQYSRSFLHINFGRDETATTHLLTYHNIAHISQLMQQLRESIIEGTFPEVVRSLIHQYFQKEPIPQWICDALQAAKIPMET